MNFIAFRTLTSTFCATGMFLALALTIGTARAQDKTYVMKITAPTLNASPDTYARNYGAAVEKESGGFPSQHRHAVSLLRARSASISVSPKTLPSLFS
jgi:hypothetical protein